MDGNQIETKRLVIK